MSKGLHAAKIHARIKKQGAAELRDELLLEQVRCKSMLCLHAYVLLAAHPGPH